MYAASTGQTMLAPKLRRTQLPKSEHYYSHRNACQASHGRLLAQFPLASKSLPFSLKTEQAPIQPPPCVGHASVSGCDGHGCHAIGGTALVNILHRPSFGTHRDVVTTPPEPATMICGAMCSCTSTVFLPIVRVMVSVCPRGAAPISKFQVIANHPYFRRKAPSGQPADAMPCAPELCRPPASGKAFLAARGFGRQSGFAASRALTAIV